MVIRTILVLLFLLPTHAFADHVMAYCEYYPIGKNQPTIKTTCGFSQYQGHIYITIANKKPIRLLPVGNSPGNFKNEKGEPVYRKSGLGKKGQIYRFKHYSIYVYWQKPSTKHNMKSPLVITKPIDY